MREGWTTKRFDEVFSLQMGKTPDRKNYALFEGNNTWVSIRDLGEKYISTSNECISDEAAANINLVKEGTVIMSFKLTVGKCAIAAKDLYTNEAIMAFNTKDGYDIDSSFLYYYLQGYNWEGANKAVMGLTLNKAIISKHKISIPPLSTQLTIVSELDKINELIRLKKEQLKDYDNLAQSIFYEMFGDPVENKKGWEVKSMEDICTNIVDCPHSTPKKVDYITNYPCIRTSELRGGSISWDTMQYLDKDEYKIRIARLKPEAGDIVFGREGTIGDAVILPIGYNFSLGQRTMLLRADSTIISNVFLHRTILSDWIRHQIEYVNVSSTVAHVNIKDFKQFKVPLPPLPLQQLFASRITQIDAQKAEVQRAITDLETLLASRMQFWFDINEAADSIVSNYYSEKLIEDRYDEMFPQGHHSMEVNYGERQKCVVNDIDFKLLAQAYNHILDNGANTLENINNVIYPTLDKAHFCVLVELGLIATEDYKTFNIPL